MQRLLVTYKATVAINLPDGVKLTDSILSTFTPDEVKSIKVTDSHEVSDRHYAVYYNPKYHELLQLTYHDSSCDNDRTQINGNWANFHNSIIPDLYEVTDTAERKLAKKGKLELINPDSSADLSTANGLKFLDNLCQWVGFDGKLPPISSNDALKGVCDMNNLDPDGWILLDQGGLTYHNVYSIYE
jgi:hypothetical protein